MKELADVEDWLTTCKMSDLTEEDMRQLKRRGFSDAQIARHIGACAGFRDWRAQGTWRHPQLQACGPEHHLNREPLHRTHTPQARP